MTTINNYESLIEKVGGIEKARAIVEGAPERATGINHVDDDEYNTYVITKPEWSIINKHAYWHVDALTGSGCWKSMANVFGGYDLLLGLIELNDLRSAIEHHYYGRSEAEELAAYAELSHEKIEGGAMLVGDFSEARKKVDQLLGNSEEFKAYVVTKFPNRSPKILFQQERINHSDYRFMVPEVQLMSDVWQLKQAEVELLQQYNDDLAGGQCCLYRELKKKDKRIEDLEFYVRQFLDVLASTHASHKEVLPKLLSHLNHLVNPKDESGEILRGEHE